MLEGQTFLNETTASGREINLYAPSEELAQSWLFLKYFDLCRANNKCFVLQQQGGACLSVASCDASGKTITVISERRSGRELLWFLACRYKKETAGHGAAQAPQERFCLLKESGHAKRENQTMMSFRDIGKEKENRRCA